MMTINQRGDDAFTRPLADRMPGFVPGSLPNRRPISAPIDAHLATAGLSALPSMYHPGPYSPRFSPYLPYSPAAAMNDPSAAMLYSAAMNPGDASDAWRAGHFHAAAAAGFYDPSMAAHYGYPYGPMGLGEGARRKNATRETTSTLKAWLNEHRKNPYPTKAEKIMLAIVTRMTLTQVSTWFANARRRLKKENKMTWSPRNRLGEDDEDDDEGQVTGGGGSAANDLSSRASSPILIDVDDDKNPSGRFDESMQATSCDHEPSSHPRVPTSVTDSHRQGPSSLGEIRRPTTDDSDSRMDFMTSPSADAKNTSDGYSPRYPYPPYHHHHHHSAAAVSAALNPYASAQSLVAASRFPGVASMNGATAAAVSSSNISATVSSAALPAGRLPFPPQSQHHPHHPHHPLHAAAAAASASGAAGPASLLHLHHPSFAQTASLIAASQRPNPALSPQVMQQMLEQQAQIQRYHQMLMNTSPTSMVTSASNPSPAPSDTSAVVSSSAAPVTTPSTTSAPSTSKPKIWSIADVATSEDKPSSKKSHDSAQPKMEPKSVPTEHHHPQQHQQTDEDAARADGRRWMDQLIQQRNHPHLTPQQLQQLNFGIHQPQLNGLTSTSAAMYHHHPVFAGISSASMRLPNKSSVAPLYGLAELLSAQQKENGGVSFAAASSISSSLLADKITSHRGQMTSSPTTQSTECQQRSIGGSGNGANEGHPRSASTSSSASTPTSKIRLMNIKKE